jgi:hypothetical protein
MMGLEEGGDSGVGWTWLDDVLDGCGIEVLGGWVDTALPQVQFNIAQAQDCMIECKGETRLCTGDKNTQQSAIQEGTTATTAVIPTKKGRRRWGAGQGNNEVEEDYNRGSRNQRLDAANGRAKEAAQRKLKKDTFNALQLPGQAKASMSFGQWQWRMDGDGGERRFGSGRQRATAATDKALSTQREVIIK